MAVGVGGGVGVTYLALHKRVCMCRGGGYAWFKNFIAEKIKCLNCKLSEEILMTSKDS